MRLEFGEDKVKLFHLDYKSSYDGSSLRIMYSVTEDNHEFYINAKIPRMGTVQNKTWVYQKWDHEFEDPVLPRFRSDHTMMVFDQNEIVVSGCAITFKQNGINIYNVGKFVIATSMNNMCMEIFE